MARKRKTKEEQMKLFDEGGLKDEGGTVDPVSGNDVPTGSTKKEVRDDIPAQLSEGEFVFPADVVRYIGLENLMELRQKAKAGLKKMEAMGQMGNSEEATMDDEGEYNDEIDQLIDNFDPNDPETMKFAQGGIVYASNGAYMPQQQFSTGYMPTTGYTAPSVPAGQQPSFITNPANVAVGAQTSAPELRRYVGPNGEILMVPFYDGKPMQGYTIPANYKYQPEEEAATQAPEIAQPVIQDDGRDGTDELKDEREAERQAQMAKDKAINAGLAALDPEFAKLTAKDPFMTGEFASPATAIAAGVQTILGRTAAIERIAKEYDINLDPFTNTGVEGVLSKYDDEKFYDSVVKGTIEDEKFKEKRDAQREYGGSEKDYQKDFGMDAEQAKAQRQEVLDEIADAVDRGDFKPDAKKREVVRGDSDGPSRNDDNDPHGGRDEGYDKDENFGFSKGGVTKQTQRALKSSRKK